MGKEYKYKVATRCFTFNHAPYIVDAMNGFAMQVTTFPVVTLIVDDASTDCEPEVIKQYLDEHFQVPYRTEETEYAQIICARHKTNENCEFVVFLLKYNHYSVKKSKLPYLSEWSDNAKYYALCEGDDYWIHPNKLQMQVDLMENNPTVGLCYTAYRYFYEPTGQATDIVAHPNECSSKDFQWKVLIRSNVGTASVIMKARLYDEIREKYNDDFKGYKMGDTQTWFHFARLSGIQYLPVVTMIYRKHEGSATALNDYEKSTMFQKDMLRMRISLCNKYNAPALVLKEINANISAMMIVNHLNGGGIIRL